MNRIILWTVYEEGELEKWKKSPPFFGFRVQEPNSIESDNEADLISLAEVLKEE